jgi:hypothetical protein
MTSEKMFAGAALACRPATEDAAHSSDACAQPLVELPADRDRLEDGPAACPIERAKKIYGRLATIRLHGSAGDRKQILHLAREAELLVLEVLAEERARRAQEAGS